MKRYIGTKIINAEFGYAHTETGIEGYKVEYSDGYIAWSPKKAFEDAYRLTDGMNFGLAIEALKAGKKVARNGWNGKGMWVAEQKPDENSKMTLPYFYMKTACENLVPWLASQTDMQADDWQIVE